MKVYQYPVCSTCKKALKFLNAAEVDYENIDITVTPPTIDELKTMLEHLGDIKKLFNTSGMVYRELGLKDKLPTMSESEALKLLSSNGKLIKRPFALGDNFGVVGFKEQQWVEMIGG